MAQYSRNISGNIAAKSSMEEAVRSTVLNYFHEQLGWTLENCEKRVAEELNRTIPRRLFDKVEKKRDWDLDEASLLDVGAGQGGAVLEALHRGADAHGVEPGPEFAELSRLRLKDDDFDSSRIHETGGEDLPFPDNSFDYAISLQVLEHVEDPRPLLEEMYRVLRPGGEAIVRCENYLAFQEQHYRVPWLPLLPRSLGSLYLRMGGRDPSFLNNYVFYTTYPQIWWLAAAVGFENETFQLHLKKNKETRSGSILDKIDESLRRWKFHLQNTFGVGINLHLAKPEFRNGSS
jgi:ubiquinone/menaquinone biosynthesis C-methylase UbiE